MGRAYSREHRAVHRILTLTSYTGGPPPVLSMYSFAFEKCASWASVNSLSMSMSYSLSYMCVQHNGCLTLYPLPVPLQVSFVVGLCVLLKFLGKSPRSPTLMRAMAIYLYYLSGVDILWVGQALTAPHHTATVPDLPIHVFIDAA